MPINLDKVPGWFKTVAAILTFCITITGAVIAMEDRYVNEAEAAETLEQVQESLQLQMKIYRYDFIDDQYNKAQRKLDEDPQNPIKEREYNELKQKRDSLQKDLGLQ